MKFLFLILIMTSSLAHAVCNFEKMDVSNKSNEGSTFKINSNRAVFLEGSDTEHRIHEGPGWLLINEQKKCKIDGGIFSDLFIDHKKNILMTKEYSGSESYTQIIDLKNCKSIGKRVTYYGAANIEDNTLINEPGCESTGNDTGSCSSGKVFHFSDKNCKLILDVKASKALTKKKLGISLPSMDKAYSIKNPNTPKAQFLK